MTFELYKGDAFNVLQYLPSNSIDSVVTDPPYGIKFMGKRWDYQIPGVDVWQQVFRVLKPGGFILCACGTRTQHRMTVNIEDAGFEIRDVIAWHYGSGFPKSLDISKQSGGEQLKGGTALKPATEFFTLARKPLKENTVVSNVIKYGTGALNIDGCKIATEEVTGWQGKAGAWPGMDKNQEARPSTGRFPANVIFDEFTGGLLDEQTGILKSGTRKSEYVLGKDGAKVRGVAYGAFNEQRFEDIPASEGGASRFFYCAKASQGERNTGLPAELKNIHPTVKPINLMRYLCRLITPVGGTVLDTYNGSGTTACACALEDFNYIGIDRDEDENGNILGYLDISRARIEYWKLKRAFV